ncbi:hypothetical protein RIR_jg28004.t1 [Rhizophagus irregularis DAOM 181602=DAOM 197198]|nr:hypothetical protein RIR_jg28004.t1 [Rhizophagus irregularis DAOM 181602=DAOM 197198]CAB4373699.1 unnamed protein product [Rhizophagus irregularis]
MKDIEMCKSLIMLDESRSIEITSFESDSAIIEIPTSATNTFKERFVWYLFGILNVLKKIARCVVIRAHFLSFLHQISSK